MGETSAAKKVLIADQENEMPQPGGWGISFQPDGVEIYAFSLSSISSVVSPVRSLIRPTSSS